jgi:amino acid adenylation domain-containing protein
VDRPFEPFPRAALQGSIVDRFDVVRRRYATRTAVADAVRCLTYAELARLVARTAAATVQAVVNRPGPVAILLPRNVNFPAAMLGAFAAGRGFVPLDPGDPIARNRLIATQSGAAAVILAGNLTDPVRTLFPNLPIIDIDAVGDIAMSEPVVRPAPDDLAFVIYTSGSTGLPKGVYLNHRNLLHIVMQMTNSLQVNEEDRVLAVRSPGTVSSTKEVLLAILNGACVHMVSPLELHPTGLVSEIQRRSITILRMAPTLLRCIADVPNANQRLASVRMVQLSGERAEWSDFDIFRRSFGPNAQFAVMLNSTEGEAASWIVDEALRPTADRLPVGYAVPDCCLSIVDDNGRPVKNGQVGEFVIKSQYVALGYWRNPEATARRFSVDQANTELHIYKTGDLGRRRSDGLFEFIGRKDDQIKLHGYRIEIDEVQFALKNCSGVEDAAVVVRRNETGLPRSLAAYVEPRRGVDDLTPRKLVAVLKTRLPVYMIPAAIVVVKNLPRLPNLKIDREELRRRDQREADCRRVISISPTEVGRTRTEERLLKLWCEVLDRQDLGYDDDFFLSGGDSVAAFDLMLRIEKEFQYLAPLTALAEAPTVREFAYRLDTMALGAINNTVALRVTGERRPIFAVYNPGDHTFALLPILRSLGPDQPCYWLQPTRMDLTSIKSITLREVAAYCVKEAKAIQPHGPYRLLGNGFGGHVVFEMALQLQEMGESVEFLGIVDTEPVTCVFEDRVDVCDSRWILRPLNAQPAPISKFEAVTRSILENHIRMARDHVLDSKSNRNIFRGELTYFHCTGNPVIAGHDRRRLWRSYASRFRLLLVPGIHGTPHREPQYTRLQNLLGACLNDEPGIGIDPASVYDRDYRMDDWYQPKNILGSMGDVYRVDQERIQGSLDEIRIDGEAIQLTGWAVEPCRQQPAQTIAVFLDGRLLGYGASGLPRPDVANNLGTATALFSGFNFIFEGAVTANAIRRPRLFVLSSDGWAAELRGGVESVAIGSVKKFSNTEHLGVILGGNWSLREQWGVWSGGRRANIIFDASSLPDSFTVVIQANLFPPVPLPTQTVRVFDESGNLLTIISNEQPNGEFTVKMQKLPAQLGPLSSLIFDIDVPTSPQELGTSQDPRKLGVGLVSLTFRE